jgi:15-cis-phytoene synthase
MTLMTQESDVRNYSYQALAKGSLSFNFAASLLGKNVRDDVVKLYAWCRQADDIADAEGCANAAEHLERFANQSFSIPPGQEAPLAARAFHDVMRRCKIPESYPRDLLQGMKLDSRGQTSYPDIESLTHYCYLVAGVVGLMMAHVMKVRHVAAYKHACDLGKAMQLTNIARDILTDANLGRVYLPHDWLRSEGLSPDIASINLPQNREALARLAQRLLNTAEDLYKSGFAGLVYLPFRCSIAVGVAGEVYREIGTLIRSRGTTAWDERAWVPYWHKWFVALRGVTRAVRTIPYRMRHFFSFPHLNINGES